MALGTGIFLIVVGATLAWGVTDNLALVNLEAIGYICVAAGFIALGMSVWINAQNRKSTHHEVVERADGVAIAERGGEQGAPHGAPQGTLEI